MASVHGGPSPSPAPSMASSYVTRTPVTREADGASGEPVRKRHRSASSEGANSMSFHQMLKPSLNRAPIKEAGRVAFLGRVVSENSYRITNNE